MIRVAVLLSTLLSVGACGGASESDPSAPEAMGGASPMTPEGDRVAEIKDTEDGTNGPVVPQSPAAFYWGGGLGNWFVTTSEGMIEDAVVEEIVPPEAEPGRACHVTGSGDGVGIDLGAQLDHLRGGPVDLSAYSGISFRARMSGVDRPLIVAFVGEGQYFSDPSAYAQRTFTLSEEWQTFELSFDEAGLEPAAAASIDFIVDGAEQPFDLWVDELAFLCHDVCP